MWYSPFARVPDVSPLTASKWLSVNFEIAQTLPGMSTPVLGWLTGRNRYAYPGGTPAMRGATKGRVRLTEEEAGSAMARLKSSLRVILAVPKAEADAEEAKRVKRVRRPRSAS